MEIIIIIETVHDIVEARYAVSAANEMTILFRIDPFIIFALSGFEQAAVNTIPAQMTKKKTKKEMKKH